MRNDGKCRLKSSGLRVINPSWRRANAPMRMSATGRLGARLRRFATICAAHADCAARCDTASQRSETETPCSRKNVSSRSASPRNAGASSTAVTGDTSRPRCANESRHSADALAKSESPSMTSIRTHESTSQLIHRPPRPRGGFSSIRRWTWFRERFLRSRLRS